MGARHRRHADPDRDGDRQRHRQTHVEDRRRNPSQPLPQGRRIHVVGNPLLCGACYAAGYRQSEGHCCSCCDRVGSRQTAAMRTRRPRSAAVARSAFAGFCFPPDVIVLAVRWYLRFALSYRDVEELLAERGVEVDHATVYRWVQRFTPLLAEAARPCRHVVGDRWQVDETHVKVAGRWRYVYRAIDQFSQVIDVFVSPHRDAAAARRFFQRELGATKITPGRGHHQPGSHLPSRAGAAASGLASHRPLRQ